MAPPEYWAVHLPRHFATDYDYHFFENNFRVLFGGLGQENMSYTFPRIPSSVENSMLKKIRSIALTLDNFVFLAPFATTHALYQTDFWLELCRLLRESGIDVFLNLAPSDPKKEYSESLQQGLCKSCSLSVAEAYALAKKSKSIIGLRSGLIDLLTLTQIPMYVLYARHRGRKSEGKVPIEKLISVYTLAKLPGVNPDIITEYNTEKMSAEEIRQNILDSLIPG
jgi:ADP-heptose:LPS heptosyltransferase